MARKSFFLATFSARPLSVLYIRSSATAEMSDCYEIHCYPPRVHPIFFSILVFRKECSLKSKRSWDQHLLPQEISPKWLQTPASMQHCILTRLVHRFCSTDQQDTCNSCGKYFAWNYNLNDRRTRGEIKRTRGEKRMRMKSSLGGSRKDNLPADHFPPLLSGILNTLLLFPVLLV